MARSTNSRSGSRSGSTFGPTLAGRWARRVSDAAWLGRFVRMESSDEVRLAVPAMPEFLRLARVTASGPASRLGFSFDEVEDLRLAIDELCYALIGRGRPGMVQLRYVVL